MKVKTIAEIAKDQLGFKSLTPSGEDRADFRSLPCWQVQRALEVAYAQGYQKAQRDARDGVDTITKVAAAAWQGGKDWAQIAPETKPGEEERAFEFALQKGLQP